MCNVTLMNILSGLVRNYYKFNITRKSDKFEILNIELNYIVMVGQVLGYYSTPIGINEESKTKNNIEIKWKEYNENYRDIKTILYFSKELDLTEDTNSVYKLMDIINTQIEIKAFIQIIEIPFEGRVDYLNKILNDCKRLKYVDLLIIYKIYNIRKQNDTYYAYLFKDSKLIEEKKVCSYYDSSGLMRMKFM